MTENKTIIEVIEAAGGLVWREVQGARKLAIVHRIRYGDEWALPKGKRKKKFIIIRTEKWIETAKREVCEEIGCEPEMLKIESFAGGTIYLAKGIPKIVLFWNMLLGGDYQLKKTDPEVNQVKWLPVDEALELLLHSEEKDLVRENWR